MKFENTSVMNFEGAFRGMRNPLESWDKSDSYPLTYDGRNAHRYLGEICGFHIGEDDLKLAQRMVLASSSERKFMRQIFVSVDVTAPLYWWKEYDTYKVATVSNSTSTMHKIANTPITLDCFETDDYVSTLVDLTVDGNEFQVGETIDVIIIPFLENLRVKYCETKDKRYWKELIRWLPNGWSQKRTLTFNYETLRTIYFDRRHHKLNEWSGKDDPTNPNFISWIASLPYAKELIMVEKEK